MTDDIEFKNLANVFKRLSPLSDQSLVQLKAQGRYVEFENGDNIFLPGDVTKELRFICSGTACHYYIKPDGSRRNKSFLQVGDVASSLSSMHQQSPALFGCDTLSKVVCFSINYENFKSLATENSEILSLSQSLLMRLAIKKESREADLLLLSLTELYQRFCKQYPEFSQTLPNYQIASYLGVSEVSLSRIRSKLGMQNSYNRAR